MRIRTAAARPNIARLPADLPKRSMASTFRTQGIPHCRLWVIRDAPLLRICGHSAAFTPARSIMGRDSTGRRCKSIPGSGTRYFWKLNDNPRCRSFARVNTSIELEHQSCASGECFACRQEAIHNLLRDFPLCRAAGLTPVRDGHGFYPGFDLEDVEKVIGKSFLTLTKTLKEDFVCHHRTHAFDHPNESLRGTVPRCCWARDLEAFLSTGRVLPVSHDGEGASKTGRLPLASRAAVSTKLATWWKRFIHKLRNI